MEIAATSNADEPSDMPCRACAAQTAGLASFIFTWF